jgi:hypothetical protein
MSKLLVHANEATAAQRRVYFHLVDATDGITAETGEAGGQPQISSDGGAWTNTGIGTLSAIGNGRYYADLTQTAVQTAGTQIETRYKSANTAECPGDSVQVVAFDPNDAAGLGLSRINANIGDVEIDTQDIQNRLPAALVSGRIDSRVGAIGTDVVTADSLAADAGTELAAAVWAAGTRTLTAFDSAFKTGYSLSAAGVQAIWDALTSAFVTAGSIGKLLVDNINATISSRSSHAAADVWASGTRTLTSNANLNDPTAAAIADAVWEEPIDDHSGTAGSTAEQLAAAGAAGDPWATALPGAYTSGQAGKIVGDNLNATVSSRASQTSVDTIAGYIDTEVASIISTLATILAAVDTEVAAIKAKTDSLPSDPADQSAVEAAITAAQSAVEAAINALNNLSSQNVRDALKLAPTAGAPAAGSVDKHLDDVQTVTDKLTFDGSNRLSVYVAEAGAFFAEYWNKIADHVRRRRQSSVESSSDGDALHLSSEYGMIQMAQRANLTDEEGKVTILKTDGSALGALDYTSEDDAEVLTGVS